LFLLVAPAGAVIIAKLPLKTILNTSRHVCVAKVESLAPDRPGIILTIDSDLKGKLSARRLAVNMKGDADSKKGDDSGKMVKRLAKDMRVLLYIQDREEGLVTFAYTNGTWFQLLGTKEGEEYRWIFLHCEPYLRRTFKGTTAELQQVTKDFLDK